MKRFPSPCGRREPSYPSNPFARAREFLALIAAAALALVSGGCMTMLSSPERPVRVLSSAPGAVASAEGQTVSTPGILWLDRARSHEVEFDAPGHAPRTVLVESRNRPGRWVGSFVLNTLAFGWWSLGIGTVVGMAVDASTGSLKDIPASRVAEPFPPAGRPAPAAIEVPPPPRAPPAPAVIVPAPPPPPGVVGGVAPERGPAANLYCPRCGERYASDDDAYCRICGTRRP